VSGRAADPERLRAQLRESWEQAATGWERRAEREGDWAMPVSAWLIEHLRLQPGETVLELAAGPGATGFLAAELVRPGGTLICSDGAEAMLEAARRRAAKLGLDNVEFRLLELEWIDLPAAGVDAVICRWGLMLVVDPEAAAREMRRVLRPGGRVALAVWDAAERNVWATLAQRALVELGHLEPPDPSAPGMFSLSDRDRLRGLLEEAGFVAPVLETVPLPREYASVEAYLTDMAEVSGVFRGGWERLDARGRAEVTERARALAEPFTAPDGRLALEGRALVVAAEA